MTESNESKSNVIPIKEKLTFHDIFFEDNVKPIKWGDDFNAWDIDRQIKYAKALASAMNEAADAMQKDRNKVFDEMVLANRLRDEAQQAAEISKQTMTQNILESNATIQDLQVSLIKAQDRIKVLTAANEQLSKG